MRLTGKRQSFPKQVRHPKVVFSRQQKLALTSHFLDLRKTKDNIENPLLKISPFHFA